MENLDRRRRVRGERSASNADHVPDPEPARSFVDSVLSKHHLPIHVTVCAEGAEGLPTSLRRGLVGSGDDTAGTWFDDAE
jgi:hypothetical protein